MLQKVALLALAGTLGTLARYGLAGLVQRIYGLSFPWGTMAVNLFGCFLAGLLWSIFEHRWTVSDQARLIVFVGFMGAFTTFSALILETGELMRSAQWFSALANMTVHNVLGFAALFVGVTLGRVA